MNTQDEQPAQREFVGPTTVISGEILPPEITALTNNIARLEGHLDAEREGRLEERFRWVLVASVLFDIAAIGAVDGSWLFLPVFMLQLIATLGFAKSCGVDWAEQLIGQLIHIISERLKKGDK